MGGIAKGGMGGNMGTIGKVVSLSGDPIMGSALEGKQGESYMPDWQSRALDLGFDEAEFASGKRGVSSEGNELMRTILAGGDGLKQYTTGSSGMQRAWAESPLLGNLLAQELLQKGPVSSMTYGKEGELSKALADVDKMRKPDAYGLTPSDQTAYGQMSGDLARMFGQSEKGLAGDLSARGLAGAESGVAGKAYSGLQGNKMEQFAGLQRQIADQAMQRAIQRDQMLRNYALQMQGNASRDIDAQFGRQLAGVGSTRNAIFGAAGLEQQRNLGKMQADMAAMQDKRGAYEPGAFDMLQGGLKNSAYQVGAAPGNFAGNFSGALGSSYGGGGGKSQDYTQPQQKSGRFSQQGSGGQP